MTETDASVKGLVFSGAKRWFEETHDRETFERFLSNLPDEDRAEWETRTFLATSRVPAEMYSNLYEAYLKTFEDGQAQFRAAAATVAFNDLNSVMKIFMRLGSPTFVANRFPVIYNSYFNVGTYGFVDTAPGAKLSAELRGAGVYGKAGCEGTLAWTDKALGYAGAKQLRVEHPVCACEGGAVCRYDYFWR